MSKYRILDVFFLKNKQLNAYIKILEKEKKICHLDICI